MESPQVTYKDGVFEVTLSKDEEGKAWIQRIFEYSQTPNAYNWKGDFVRAKRQHKRTQPYKKFVLTYEPEIFNLYRYNDADGRGFLLLLGEEWRMVSEYKAKQIASLEKMYTLEEQRARHTIEQLDYPLKELLSQAGRLSRMTYLKDIIREETTLQALVKETFENLEYLKQVLKYVYEDTQVYAKARSNPESFEATLVKMRAAHMEMIANE
jgi:hypothetical protein